MIQVSTRLREALESNHFEHYYAVELPNSLNLTDAQVDKTVDGTTYLGNGLLQSVGTVSRNGGMTLNSLSIELTNVDRSVATSYYSGDVVGLPVKVLLIIEDTAGIAGSMVVYEGTLDGVSVDQSTTDSKLAIKSTSHWASFNQRGGLYTSDAVQIGRHPGDRIFKFAHEKSADALGWGQR